MYVKAFILNTSLDVPFILANLHVHVLNKKHCMQWLLQSVDVCALYPLELLSYKFLSLSIILSLQV